MWFLVSSLLVGVDPMTLFDTLPLASPAPFQLLGRWALNSVSDESIQQPHPLHLHLEVPQPTAPVQALDCETMCNRSDSRILTRLEAIEQGLKFLLVEDNGLQFVVVENGLQLRRLDSFFAPFVPLVILYLIPLCFCLTRRHAPNESKEEGATVQV
jgi:hypothetical protein